MEILNLGELPTLDLSNRELCYRILSCDKYQLPEGMIIESLMDQVFKQLENKGVTPVHHSTLVAQRKEKKQKVAASGCGQKARKYLNI